MWYQAKEYFRFLSTSRNQHGIHSPFVFDLVTKCFYDKKKYPEYELMKQMRTEAIADNELLEITDLGSGSKVMGKSKRRVSEIARKAGIPTKRQQLLFRLCRYLDCRNILELGTSVGMGTLAASLSNKEASIHTVEGCPNTIEKAKKLLSQYGNDNVHFHNDSFIDFLGEPPIPNFDLVYIDGDHSKAGTLQYFEMLVNHTHNNSVFIFDDIYWKREMTEAWVEIANSPKVSVSIDTYHWGLVFFRKEQRKQHFRIRL